MTVLSWILWPFIALMGAVLEFYVSIFSAVGTAIIALSLTFCVLMIPVLKKMRRVEARITARMQAARRDLAAERGDLKGEALFNLTEKIYARHGYHPIQSVGQAASLFAMLPVLISSIILLTGSPLLAGHSFLFIPDLSQPDRLLGGVNALPILMFALTAMDARYRYRDDRPSMFKFMGISALLLVLVYDLASGLVLYWITSNLFSFAMAVAGQGGVARPANSR